MCIRDSSLPPSLPLSLSPSSLSPSLPLSLAPSLLLSLSPDVTGCSTDAFVRGGYRVKVAEFKEYQRALQAASRSAPKTVPFVAKAVPSMGKIGSAAVYGDNTAIYGRSADAGPFGEQSFERK
eukprot:3665174-Rhodomonas_salina.1